MQFSQTFAILLAVSVCSEAYLLSAAVQHDLLAASYSAESKNHNISLI